MSPRVVPDEEPIWRALADPTRRAVLDALHSGPRTTGELTQAFPTTRFAVMKHLGVLVEAGLVTVERRGRERLNHLNPVPLQQTYERWVRPRAATVAGFALALAERTERTTMGDYGLDVRAEHTVRAGIDPTWAALMELDTWWNPCWPEGERLLFEPHLGGRLGTTADDRLDTGTLWGTVSVLLPGRELALDGTMGLPGPIAGRWTMALTPDGAATTVTVEHRVLGPVADDDRAGFTRGWPATLASLAARAESGS